MDGPISENIDFAALSKVFSNAKPFPHIIIDNFLNAEIAEQLADDFPHKEDICWYEYNNPMEKKLASNLKKDTPATIANILAFFQSDEFLDKLSIVSSINGLMADPSLHGGGMHCIPEGGKLDIHLDYRIHPQLHLERRANLIYYLNKDWDPQWGGDLEFWNADMTKCQERIAPVFNRAVIFKTGDVSFHGHPDPVIECEGHTRNSLAVYYLSEVTEGATERYRAQYVKRPQDPYNPELEKLRAERSKMESGSKVYRCNLNGKATN